MKNDPEEDTAAEGDDLPVINIDDDPNNANWIRILEQRRQERSDDAKQPPPQSPPER